MYKSLHRAQSGLCLTLVTTIIFFYFLALRCTLDSSPLFFSLTSSILPHFWVVIYIYIYITLVRWEVDPVVFGECIQWLLMQWFSSSLHFVSVFSLGIFFFSFPLLIFASSSARVTQWVCIRSVLLLLLLPYVASRNAVFNEYKSLSPSKNTRQAVWCSHVFFPPYSDVLLIPSFRFFFCSSQYRSPNFSPDNKLWVNNPNTTASTKWRRE